LLVPDWFLCKKTKIDPSPPFPPRLAKRLSGFKKKYSSDKYKTDEMRLLAVKAL
jgi:hypothetical protein